jgi:hypothetical protein
LKFTILRPAAMQAKHQQAVLGPGAVERLFDPAEAMTLWLNASSNGLE